MRKYILLLVFGLMATAISAQSPFKFECLCTDAVTGDSCDVCTPSSNISSRSFSGLMVYRYNTGTSSYDPYKWIDAPYSIRKKPGESLEFLEYGTTNPDRITISRTQTQYFTMAGYMDSTWCGCNNNRALWYATDSTDTAPIFQGDTVMIVGAGGTTVTFDSVLQKYVIYSVAGGGGSGTVTNFSFTDGNGFDGTVTNPTTTPNLSMATTVTGIIYGSGGSLNPVTVGSGLTFSAPTLSVTNPLGTGTQNYFPKWGASGAGLTSTSQMFDDGTNIGVNTNAPFARMHVNSGDYGAYKNTSGTDGASLFLGDQNFNNSGFFDKAPGLRAVWSAGAGVAGNLGFYTYNGTRNLRMLLTYDGLLGVNQTSPTERVDIVGNLKISGAFKPGGNGGTTGYKLISQGASSAPIWELDTKFYQYDVVIPTIVSNAQGFVQITNGNFSANTEIWLTVADGGFAQSKRYFLPTTYNGTSGAWHKCLPISSSGAYSGNDCEIDVNVDNAIAYFRVRRTAGSTAGTARITFLVAGYISGTTVSNFTTAYTSQVVSTDYAPTSVVQINGNTGIATDSPQKTLHVAGTARITGSDGTATTITGRDADGDISNVGIGTGLSLSGGTLSSTISGSKWTDIGADIGRNSSVAVGTVSSVQGSKLNVEGLGTSGIGARFNGGTFASGNTGVQIGGNATTQVYGLDVNMTVTGNNLINRFRNGSTGNALNQIAVSSTGGDPMQQFQTEGDSGFIWVTGIDNSLADKFRIEPNPAIGDDELGLHILTTSEFGFGKAPSASHSAVWGLAKPLGLPSGASSARAFGTNAALWYNSTVLRTEIFCASHNIYKGVTSNGTPTISNIYSNAGVGATVTLSTGSNDMTGQITFTTGTTGLLAGQQFELQFAGAFSGQVFVFLQSRSATFSAQNTNFFVGTQGTGAFKVDVATALPPSTAYIFNYKVEQ